MHWTKLNYFLFELNSNYFNFDSINLNVLIFIQVFKLHSYPRLHFSFLPAKIAKATLKEKVAKWCSKQASIRALNSPTRHSFFQGTAAKAAKCINNSIMAVIRYKAKQLLLNWNLSLWIAYIEAFLSSESSGATNLILLRTFQLLPLLLFCMRLTSTMYNLCITTKVENWVFTWWVV